MKKIFTLMGAALAALSVQAQTWSVSSSDASAGSIAVGTTLVDNTLATVATVYGANAGTILNEAGTAAPVTLGSYTFSNYTQVRVAEDPSVATPTGTENSGSTPLVVTAKQNTDISFYFRRQSVSVNDGASYTFTAGDGKDLLCADNKTLALVAGELTIYEKVQNDAYAYVKETFKLQAGKQYVFYRKGSTIQLYGFDLAEGTYEASSSESWTSSATATNIIELTSIKAEFLNNTSKGSTAGQGTWTFAAYAAADQNGCEILFTPTSSGKLTITFGGALANNKSINMYVDNDPTNTLACKLTADDTEVASGAAAPNGVASGSGVYYNLQGGHTYNFYCAGTKYRISGFTFDVTTGISSHSAVSSTNEDGTYNLAGQQVDKTYKGVVIRGGKKFIQK